MWSSMKNKFEIDKRKRDGEIDNILISSNVMLRDEYFKVSYYYP